MFSKLGLGPSVCAPLARLGYTTPTPVQTQAIPHVLSGVDLLARAQTGTGKTAAFGLPMIESFLSRPSAGGRVKPRGLVLVPTRELAAQVHHALTAYAGTARLRVTAIFGGVGMGPQIQALHRGTDIVVATPGRLIDHLQRRTVDLSAVEVLTLDEADRMLDMGFLPALRRVVAAVPRTRQTLLFSATLSEDIVRLSAEFTRDAVRVDVSAGQTVAVTVSHVVHHVALDRKRDVLAQVLTADGGPQALVFCRTKRGANRVGDDLDDRGLRAAVIHGNKSQHARTRALDDFKTGRVRVLVATDIAARGLDIAQLPLVVNFDLPLVAEDYVHRVGRTGRAGHQGRAVSLVSAADAGLLRDIQRLVASPLECAGDHAGRPAESRPRAPHRAGPPVGRREDRRNARRDGVHHARPGFNVSSRETEARHERRRTQPHGPDGRAPASGSSAARLWCNPR
jgi:ATP-dependent RNA helicase RhlE